MMLYVVCSVYASWYVVNHTLIYSHGMWLICCCRSFNLSVNVSQHCSPFPSFPFPSFLAVNKVNKVFPSLYFPAYQIHDVNKATPVYYVDNFNQWSIRSIRSLQAVSHSESDQSSDWVREGPLTAAVAEWNIAWCSAMPRPSCMPLHHPSYHPVTRQSVSVLISHWLNLLPTQLIHDVCCVMCDVRLLLCDTPSIIHRINWQALHITTATTHFYQLFCLTYTVIMRSSYHRPPSQLASWEEGREGEKDGERVGKERNWLASP